MKKVIICNNAKHLYEPLSNKNLGHLTPAINSKNTKAKT